MTQYRLTMLTCITVSGFVLGGCASELRDISHVVPSGNSEYPTLPPVQVPGPRVSQAELLTTTQHGEQQSKDDDRVPEKGVIVPVPTSAKRGVRRGE